MGATAPLSYHRPKRLAEACALGARLGADAAYLAGGTELVPDYRRGRETAKHLIALGGIPELCGIRVEDGALHVGALTTVAEVARSGIVREWLTAFSEAARSLGSPQVRSIATVGGNFCRAVACADLPPAAIVGRARLKLVSVGDERVIDAADLFAGARQTVLQRGEILAEIAIPPSGAHTGTSYQRFSLRRGMALAVASAAARVVLSNGKIANAAVALGGVAAASAIVPGVNELLAGERPNETLFAEAGELCARAAQPITDVRGTQEFRREVVAVMARRALETAAERAVSNAGALA